MFAAKRMEFMRGQSLLGNETVPIFDCESPVPLASVSASNFDPARPSGEKLEASKARRARIRTREGIVRDSINSRTKIVQSALTARTLLYGDSSCAGGRLTIRGGKNGTGNDTDARRNRRLACTSEFPNIRGSCEMGADSLQKVRFL